MDLGVIWWTTSIVSGIYMPNIKSLALTVQGEQKIKIDNKQTNEQAGQNDMPLVFWYWCIKICHPLVVTGTCTNFAIPIKIRKILATIYYSDSSSYVKIIMHIFSYFGMSFLCLLRCTSFLIAHGPQWFICYDNASPLISINTCKNMLLSISSRVFN